jgi:hypothetical protein
MKLFAACRAAALKRSAGATKATCVAYPSPLGTLWVPGFVTIAQGFSPTGDGCE